MDTNLVNDAAVAAVAGAPGVLGGASPWSLLAVPTNLVAAWLWSDDGEGDDEQ